jgi:transcriptional regulator NrdR family protein
MAKEVIKRGGKRERFSAAKVKAAIRGACKDIHLPAKRTKVVVAKVSAPVLKFAKSRKTVRTSVLRAKSLAGLRKIEPKAAKAWLRYEKMRRARRVRARRRR